MSPTGCHERDYKVHNSKGNLVNVQDVKVGDNLMGVNSTRKVIKLYNGFSEFVSIKLSNDIIFNVNEEHILHLERTGDDYKKLNFEKWYPKYIDISVKEYMNWAKSKKHLYKIKRSGYEKTENNNDLVDSYFLGLWLGDGTSGTACNYITTKDSEISEVIYNMADKLKYTVSKTTKNGNKASTYGIINKKGQLNELRQYFKNNNLVNNKHIPERFFTYNREERTKLLSGIIDSDGYTSNNINYEITQKSKKLSEDIYRLAGSLGLNPSIIEVFKSCTNCKIKTKNKYYKVCFRLDEPIYCVLDYKKPVLSKPNKNKSLYSFEVKKIGKKEYFGFELDGDRLYIDENFIVQHNSGKSIYPSIISKVTNEPHLVIQPNVELLEQNVEKARILGLDPSIYSASAGTKEISDLTYATPMSIISRPEDFRHFKKITLDECHLNMSNKMESGKVKSKGKLNDLIDYINPDKVIGMTASPIQLVTTGRGSELKMLNRSMRSFWYKSNIMHITQIPDIKEKYWADIKTEVIPNDKSKLFRKQFNSPEFDKDSIVAQYEANNLNKQIVEQYENMMSRGINNILTFVPSVEQAIQLKKQNPGFEIVYDKTPKKERKAIVEAFKRGDISHLINCMVFTAGFDHASLKGLILARETMSLQLFYQIYGRLVRNIYKDGILTKKEGLIVDLTGNTDRFGDISNMTFEKNDYTNGWGMWNDDRLLTGYPFGDWDMPTRDKLSKEFNSKGIISKNESIEDVSLNLGKYKGKSLLKSFEKDPRYFVWMLNNFDWTKPWTKPLHKPLEQLVNKYLMHGS